MTRACAVHVCVRAETMARFRHAACRTVYDRSVASWVRAALEHVHHDPGCDSRRETQPGLDAATNY
jgi:hypothetical protein